jgi:hypothetical protein
MAELLALGRDYGWALVFVILFGWGVWKLRDKWLSLIDRRLALGEQEREKELNFEDASRLRLLNMDTYSRDLVDRLFSLYEDERIERKMMGAQVAQLVTSTEKMVNAALDTMLQFADISRMSSDRITGAVECQTAAVNEFSKISAAHWFTLTRLYGVRGGDVQAAMEQLDSEIVEED